jgi:hypothetical protein
MKIRKFKNKNGHIIVIRHRENPADNFSVFLSNPGFDQLKALKKVRESFVKMVTEDMSGWLMENHSVGDLREVEYEVENLDKDRIVSFALEDFFTEGDEFVTLRVKAVLSILSRSKEGLLPSIRTGGVASGADFFDRDQQISQVWETVEKGSDCILRAPRRFGKTSLAIYLAMHPKPGWRVCYADLEGERCAEDFIFSILKTMADNPDCAECLPNELSDRVIWNLAPEAKQELYEREWENIQKDWRAYGNNIFNTMRPDKGNLLLILDEFSFLAENILKNPDSGEKGLVNLLDWFKDIRKKRPEGLFFLVSGSEHLPSFLDSMGIANDLSNLVTIHLEPFDPDSAHAFIFLAMAKQNISVSPEECSHILELMGKPVPYFLQLFLDILVKKCRAGEDISKKQMDAVYQRELLGTESKRHFESIKRQLDQYGHRDPRFSTAAARIMTLLTMGETVEKKTLESEWAELTSMPESFQSMFEIMRDDFYLKEQNGRVRLDSKILKDWWRVHMLSRHTP